MTEREKTKQSGLSIGMLQAKRWDDRINNKSVVIVADHDSFGWSSGTTSIDKGRTVTWFLCISSLLQSILFPLWIKSTYIKFYLSPIAIN